MRSRRRPLIWSPEARDDLADLIEDFPLSGRARDELRPGLRSLAVAPRVVFYRVTDEGPEIVRVLDGRRDLDELFAETPSDP